MNNHQLVWKKHAINGRFLVAREGTPAYDFFGPWDASIPLPEADQAACAKILESGGTYILWEPQDDDIARYGTRGQAFGAERVTKRRGLPSQCHRNAALLWEVHPKRYRITTGYALSEDGMWRQHTFLTRKDGSVIETTAPREKYFGYVLNDQEAARFFLANF